VRREWAGPPVCAVCVYRQGEESPVRSLLESCCEEGAGWATSTCMKCVCTGRVRSPLCWVAWSPAVRNGLAGPPVCSVCVYRQGEESPVRSLLESCCEEGVGWATSTCSVCVQAG
jgi:hypothetical protein